MIRDQRQADEYINKPVCRGPSGIEDITTRTQYALKCDCGREGYVVRRKNDQPHSTPWENFSMEGFSGGSHGVEGGFSSVNEALSEIKPECPSCGRGIKKRHLVEKTNCQV